MVSGVTGKAIDQNGFLVVLPSAAGQYLVPQQTLPQIIDGGRRCAEVVSPRVPLLLGFPAVFAFALPHHSYSALAASGGAAAAIRTLAVLSRPTFGSSLLRLILDSDLSLQAQRGDAAGG